MSSFTPGPITTTSGSLATTSAATSSGDVLVQRQLKVVVRRARLPGRHAVRFGRRCHCCAGSYRGDAGIESWAKRIAVRTTLRYLKRERRRRPDVSLQDVGEPRHGERAPQHAVTLSRDVRVFLESVSEVQRTALVLHHALGYSLDEVAEMTGASANTVKSRLRLGTRALRKRVRREQRIGAEVVTAARGSTAAARRGRDGPASSFGSDPRRPRASLVGRPGSHREQPC